jgi:hypothetical protein
MKVTSCASPAGLAGRCSVAMAPPLPMGGPERLIVVSVPATGYKHGPITKHPTATTVPGLSLAAMPTEEAQIYCPAYPCLSDAEPVTTENGMWVRRLSAGGPQAEPNGNRQLMHRRCFNPRYWGASDAVP